MKKQMIKEIIYLPTQEILVLPRGTTESLTTRVNNEISNFNSGIIPVSRLGQLAVGLYLQHVGIMGNFGARKFVRNYFAISK